MADQVLSIKVHDVNPKQNGQGAWVKAFMSMGKDRETGSYNDGLWMSLHFPANYPAQGDRITVKCYGMGWDCYTPQSTGIERKTPKFHVNEWHAQVAPSNQGYGVQQQPPASSYQNQYDVPF